ncbi:antiterminator Q family protein [Thorsellia anophelis]|uniref:Phage antitermination protein Q n=1 Tax=Thorsellia anophelis DSM 18579 TaxID=1123402 RepID=A0A1I0CCV8_9GAMM|nr:antiterminator Q family protein [Thorsellia anophelis]SET16945.1 Phage antitermination protein Q [Thorsellia anophelis DSM 18579]
MQTLTKQQIDFIDDIMERWGAWVYSGRIEVRQISLIGKLIASINPQNPVRSMCDDDTGLLISRIVSDIKLRSPAEYEILIQYYVYMNNKYQISVWLYSNRETNARGHSLTTYRNLVDKTLYNIKKIIFLKYIELSEST